MGRKSQERGQVVLLWTNYSTSSASSVSNVVSEFSVAIGWYSCDSVDLDVHPAVLINVHLALDTLTGIQCLTFLFCNR